MRNMSVRPHHAICAHFFAGKDYNEQFVEHMYRILTMLKNDNSSVTLTSECDCICSKCPNNNNGKCTADEKVRKIDSRTIEILGMNFGNSLTWRELCETTERKIIITGKLKDVCCGCEWINICDRKKCLPGELKNNS